MQDVQYCSVSDTGVKGILTGKPEKAEKIMPHTMAEQTISTLAFSKPRWRNLILFQSWPQFQSWVALVLLSSLVLQLLFIALGADEIPVAGIVVGALLGSLGAVISVIPANFNIAPPYNRLIFTLKVNLESIGYIPAESVGNVTVYRQNLSRIWRWEEGNVQIRVDKDQILVTGAQGVVRLLHRSMRKAGCVAKVGA